MKIGRNDPCPCGSGKKYKKCCLGKADDVYYSNPLNLLDTYKKVRKESRIRQCLHPKSDECSEKIIGAHSIQNNKIIKRLSSNGIVYMPCPKSDNPFAQMTVYGRKEATVFTGFCGYHDKTVFQPIEDGMFDKSIQHIFLYTYRCFAVEYHKKQEVVNMERNMFKIKPSLADMPDEDNPYRGMHMAIDDLENVKKIFDTALLTGN
ncbi:TPA: YecA family protein, partial [Streptococcus suis]